MSPAAKRSRTTYYEILVQGNPDRFRGLVTGLVLGVGTEAELLFAQEIGVRTPLGERILDLVHAHAGVSHVIADSAGRKLLASFRTRLEGIGFKIADEKKITSARFEYSFHAYAKKYATEIKESLATLPKAVKHEPGPTKETQDVEAKGVEVYSPVHDYEIQGSGKISGPVHAVLDAREQLGRHPLVKVDEVELETA